MSTSLKRRNEKTGKNTTKKKKERRPNVNEKREREHKQRHETVDHEKKRENKKGTRLCTRITTLKLTATWRN